MRSTKEHEEHTTEVKVSHAVAGFDPTSPVPKSVRAASARAPDTHALLRGFHEVASVEEESISC